MTDEPDERVNQYTELMRRLFEESIKKGGIQPGEIDVIIAATILPKYTETETRQDREVPVIREPVFERHEHGDSVTITADLPGTAPEDIQYALFGEVLYLTARAEGIIYRATYLVGGAVADTLTHTFKHGVIEFTYQKQDIPPEKEV